MHDGAAPEGTPIARALPAAEELLGFVRAAPGVLEVHLAGDLRRFRPAVERIELVAAAHDPASAAARLLAFPEVREVLDARDGESEVRLASGAPARLLAVRPDRLAAALLWRTGTPGHLAALAARARARGLELGVDGLRDARGRLLPAANEDDLLRPLGLPAIPPELRENEGALDAAAAGALPPLVAPADVRGLAHAHTTWSDGRHSLLDMARAARALGFSYLTITDHSPSSNGVTLDELKAQREELEHVREAVPGIVLLHGTETDVDADGRLDHPDDVLAWLDVVVASVHRELDRDERTQTRRLVAAIRHPLVSWIGHPTGRYHGYSPGYRIRLEELADAAAEAGKPLEVNGTLGRLDLSAPDLRTAIDRGAKVIAAADAHSTAHLVRAFHAARTCRRGGARPEEVVTTLPVDGFLRAVGRPEAAARYAASREAASATLATAGSFASSERS